jgi:signal transduction histidine kinase/ActR/RegA family two-component response regulator
MIYQLGLKWSAELKCHPSLRFRVDDRFKAAAEHFRSGKPALLARWRTLVRADANLPEQRVTFSDRELEDHLPALLDSIVEALEGQDVPEETIREEGAQHGHWRRISGYTIVQVTWELAIFRKLLRETLEELASAESSANLFATRELILALVDRSEVGAIQQYVEETSQERDLAREALKEANAQKDRFLAVLSHELRNPLAAIRTALHILKTGSFSEIQRQRALGILERQTNHQRRLVDDLLDVNRISQGRIALKREQIDLREPIKSAIETFHPAIESKAIKFQYDGPDHEVLASADPVRIEQIISNLLDNALKSTRSGDSIEIRLIHQQDVAIISMLDTGTGIEPSRLDHLFELFSRRTSGTTDIGLGIGLWLAKTLTEMHDGTIRATSDGPGKGTQLVVQLPCLQRDMGKRSEHSKRVLIVEDDPDQRELWLLALSEMDAEIAAAKDGADALKMASEGRFDVCILDLNLPDISGYALLQQLLTLHARRRPVTIALTGFGRPEDETRVKAAGFDYHIVKPADITFIQQIINQSEKLS